MGYSIEGTRRKRMQMYRKCFFLKTQVQSVQLIDRLTWKDVEEVPDWLLLNENELARLINICGAIFLLPNIKLWIETSRLVKIKQLVGDDIYNELINAEINHAKVVINHIEDVVQLVKLSGMSVLKSTISNKYGDILSNWKLDDSYNMDINLAKTFVDLSLMLITKYQ